jgi:hypothetical protein
VRGVALVLEHFAIHSFDLLGVACNQTSRSNPRINFVHHSLPSPDLSFSLFCDFRNYFGDFSFIGFDIDLGQIS